MGKGASKLKKKASLSNLSWTRFGSLPLRPKSKARTDGGAAPPATATKHLDIGQWLKAMDLSQYEEAFRRFGGVEDLLECSEADIRDLGVRISSHRAMIISNLTVLRAKYYGNFSRQRSVRHSVAVDSRNKIQIGENKEDFKTMGEGVQSKSLNNLIMEPTADPAMNALELKKTLEWELSLDSRDLRSHAWYHGAIPRARAEDIVREEGGFLVRDCTSQPGNFVLTCRTNKQALHFVINKIILQPDTVYEHVQYQFEEDAFDTVPDLITFYVGSGKPVTVASGARIQSPKNRMYPLSFYATKYPAPLPPSRLASPATTPVGGPQLRHSPLPPHRPSCSPTRRDAPPRLPSKKQRSQSLTPAEVNRIAQEKCNSADGVIQPLMTRSAGSDAILSAAGSKFSTHSLPRSPHIRLSLTTNAGTLGRNNRVTSDPTLSPCAERRLIGADGDSPPPKPSRIPSIARPPQEAKDAATAADCRQTFESSGCVPPLQRVCSYHTSGSDSGNGSGDSAVSSAAGDNVELPFGQRGVVIKNPRFHIATSESSTTLKNYQFEYAEAEEKLMELIKPVTNTCSRFDIDNFQTLLLPVNENKPLDAQALRGVKMILQESGPRILANHLTRTDLDLIFSKQNHIHSQTIDGIELCTLPHGHQFRLDLIERTECLKLLVAVTILTCTDDVERTDTLNKWIEIAIDTKTALGNLYGFSGIMLGLSLPQIENLNNTWHMLRQKYTDSAFNFEAKLRPTLKNMNNCSNPQAPNTTIPYLLPFILLLERDLDDFLSTTNDQNQLSTSCLGLWENNTQDFGLTTLLNHLDTARKYIDTSATYQRNAEIVLGETRMDELTVDMFKTEFQMKFLWGSRGAFANASERHSKFEQVLTVMADKYCNSRENTEI